MDRTLIVCASHHGVALETQHCLTAMQKHGAQMQCATGIADVALARNQVLTRALVTVPTHGANVLLLVDDDMVWDITAAAKVVSLARETGKTWSAAYATKDGHLAATPYDWDASRTDGLRMVGLGFCAVPVQQLAALARTLDGPVIGPHDTKVIPFCQSGVVKPEHDGIARWCSEDYWLCRALGGVRLAPYVAAGHLKSVPLWPDDETLRRLAEGEALAAEPESPDKRPSSEPPSTARTGASSPNAKRNTRKRQKARKRA